MGSREFRRLFAWYNAILAPIVIVGVLLIVIGKRLGSPPIMWCGIILMASSPISSYIMTKKFILPRMLKGSRGG